jgi:hypothetical protein
MGCDCGGGREEIMNFGQLQELRIVWMDRLGLQNWRINMHLVTELEEKDAYMEVHRSDAYERATIRVPRWLLDSRIAPPDGVLMTDAITDEFIEVALVHELMHLYFRDLRRIISDDIYGILGREAYGILQSSADRAEEQAVDKLAESLVKSFNPWHKVEITNEPS